MNSSGSFLAEQAGTMDSSSILLTPAEMGRADALAVAAGVPSLTLMENAGAAVAEVVQERYPDGEVLVFCGPGNNGGDGFVAAIKLREQGRRVRVALFGQREQAEGRCGSLCRPVGRCRSRTPEVRRGRATVIVDALLGAGLDRDVEGALCTVLQTLLLIRGWPPRSDESATPPRWCRLMCRAASTGPRDRCGGWPYAQT